MAIEVPTDDPIDVVDATAPVDREMSELEYGGPTVFVEHTTAAGSNNEAELSCRRTSR